MTQNDPKRPEMNFEIIGESNKGPDGPIESVHQSLFLKMWETDTIADALQANVQFKNLEILKFSRKSKLLSKITTKNARYDLPLSINSSNRINMPSFRLKWPKFLGLLGSLISNETFQRAIFQ